MTIPDPNNETTYKTCVICSDLKEAETPKCDIMREMESFQYSESSVFAIKLALEEALSNAVKHGNRRDPTKKITIRYAVNQECAAFIIRDEGEGFTPEEIPDPTDPEFINRPTGRGILLLNTYMDKVEYRDSGREIFFMKKNTHDVKS